MPELRESIHPTGPGHLGVASGGILALVNRERLRRILAKMLDENEFLSPYGIRSLSRSTPSIRTSSTSDGQEYRVDYLPAESNTGMFGGNSNWRGPVWMPVNVLIIRALLQYYCYYGDDFKIECPTGSGSMMNLFEVSRRSPSGSTGIFLRDEHGRRPVYGGAEKFQTDPHWRDHILFYEYFHGDNGAGLGASHQTGWTRPRGQAHPAVRRPSIRSALLAVGKKAAFVGTDKGSPMRAHHRGAESARVWLVWTGPGAGRGSGSVLVEAIAVGVCGTDVEIVEGKYGWAPPVRRDSCSVTSPSAA